MNDAPKRNPLPLDKCSVLITGGTSGVGLATAIQFAEAGVPRIGINGRNAERGEKARQTVKARVPKADVQFFAGDANEVSQAKAICEGAREQFGSVDVLVNSTVGPYGPTLFHKIRLEEIQQMVVKQMMALCSPAISCCRGCASAAASDRQHCFRRRQADHAGQSVLGAAMAAIIMFSRTLAIEAKRDGIRYVNA